MGQRPVGQSDGGEAPMAELTATQSQEIQPGGQSGAQPASTIASEWRFARRHWLFAAMVAVFLATSMAAFVLTVREHRQASGNANLSIAWA